MNTKKNYETAPELLRTLAQIDSLALIIQDQAERRMLDELGTAEDIAILIREKIGEVQATILAGRFA